MAVREIKTTIALDGEQKFKQAIAAVNQSLRVSETEMKAVTAAYKESGDEATYMAEKQRVLGEQIESQKSKISMLEGMLDKAKAAYEQAGNTLDEYRRKLEAAEKSGDVNATKELAAAVERAEKAYFDAGKKVNDYKIQLNNARANMSNLRTTTEKADREVEELGRDSIKAGRQLEQGIGEGAEEAEKDVKSLIRTMQEDISSIRTSGAVSAITGLWNTATSAFDAVEGFVSGTADYRRQLSFLMQNAVESGLSGESVEDQLIEVQGIIGESAAAMEGLNNLLQIGFDEPMFNRAMQGLLGAYAAFPETLGFGPLSESLQETLATGRATGQYAELLERLKIDIDDFNKALEESPNEIGDMEIALSYLEAEELDEAYKQYRKDNEDLIREMEAIAKIEFQSARLGEKVSKYLTTPTQEAWGNLLDWIADTIEVAEKEGLGAAASKVGSTLQTGAGMMADATEIALDKAEEKVDDFVVESALKLTNAMGLDYSDNDVSDAWSQAKQMMFDPIGYIEDRFGGYKGFKAAANTGQNGAPTLEQQLTNFLMQDLDMSLFTPKEATGTSLLDKWKQTILDTQEALKEAEPDLKEGGEEAGEALADGFEIGANGVTGRARIAGMDAGKYFGMGLLSQVSYVTMASAQLAAAAASRLASGGAVSGATGTGRAGTIVMQLDGREVGRALLPYQSEGMAVTEVNVE